MQYDDLKNGLAVLYVEVPRTGNKIKFIVDTEDIKKIIENGPWYWKESNKTTGQLPVLTNRNGTPITKLLMNPTGNDRVFNVSRNPFDIRKINLIVSGMGSHQSFGFKAAVKRIVEENKESYEFVQRILDAGQIFTSEKEIAVTKDSDNKKIQDQVPQLNPVKTKTRVLQDLASNEIVLQFEDGTHREISIQEAQYLAQIFQRLS